jgi:hypothetical protein
MTDPGLVSEVRAIAERSAKAAEVGATELALADAYEELRARAITLALAHRLASLEELTDQFPTLPGLREIERLNLAFGDDSVSEDRGASARLRRALVELAAWATGIRLAFAALERDSDRDA